MNKNSFVMYTDYMQHLDLMSMEQRGVFLTAIMQYVSCGEVPEMDGMVKMAFSFAKAQIDRDTEQYQKIVEAKREAGRKGGEAKARNAIAEASKASTAKNFLANLHDTDTVTDTDTVNNKNILADARDLFERLWRLYPCKKGKGQVSDTQKKRLLAIGEAELVKAIERYSSELQKDAGWRKPQNGSTFFNSGYVDYLDENFVPSDTAEKSEKRFEEHSYDMNDLTKKLLE